MGKRVINAILYMLVALIIMAAAGFVTFVFGENAAQNDHISVLTTNQQHVMKTLDVVVVNQQNMMMDLATIKGEIKQALDGHN